MPPYHLYYGFEYVSLQFPQRTELILKLLQPIDFAIIKIHMVLRLQQCDSVYPGLMLDRLQVVVIHLLPASPPATPGMAESGTLPPYGKHHR